MLLAYCVQHACAQANQNLSNLTSPVAVNVALLPQSDNSLNLGSAAKSWKSTYLDGSIYMGSLRFISYKTGTGRGNTALGSIALNSNTTGINNTATSYQALYSNTTRNPDEANGYQALQYDRRWP